MHIDRVEVAYRAHHPRLWRALLAYTGDRELASDAEAEAFAQAIRRGDGIDDVGAWVWRAAFKIAAGRFDRPEREPVDAPTGDAADAASMAEFMSLLGDLTRQQRACVVLRYVGGFTSAEIADLLGTTQGTVRVQLHRAVQTLKTTLRLDEEAR